MDIKESINDTRNGFEESFAAGNFYNRQTQDFEHLKRILEFVKISDGMRILDLGTGSGYLSFPIAKNNRGCAVIGLDIVSDALIVNRAKADAEGIINLSFESYDGIDFPFDANFFDLIKFYTKEEWVDICGRHGLVFKNGFDSSIRFPKKKDTAYGYKDVLKRHDKAVIDSYELVETDTELYLTEQVNNVLFEKH